MEVKDLKLEAIEFSDVPTKTQLVNTIRSIQVFLARMGAALIMDGSYSIADQPLGVMLNASVSLKQSADLFEGGNSSGLAIPQPGPVPMRRQ